MFFWEKSTCLLSLAPQMNLKGKFPNEFQLLSNLEYISISGNPGVAGAFPDSLRKMSNLNHLSINSCSFSSIVSAASTSSSLSWVEKIQQSKQDVDVYDTKGISPNIPAWIGELSSLIHLELSNNGLTGPIPFNEIKKLSKLQRLVLDNNNLSGSIDDLVSPIVDADDNERENEKGEQSSSNTFTNYPKQNVYNWSHNHLRVLSIKNNQITGNLDSSGTLLISKHKNLKILDLSNNNIVSKLPSSLFHNANLVKIDLHSNRLYGHIPKIHGSEGTAINYHSSSIEQTITTGPRKLKYLALNDNQLTGKLPWAPSSPLSSSSFFNDLPSLQHLDVSNNQLQLSDMDIEQQQRSDSANLKYFRIQPQREKVVSATLSTSKENNEKEPLHAIVNQNQQPLHQGNTIPPVATAEAGTAQKVKAETQLQVP